MLKYEKEGRKMQMNEVRMYDKYCPMLLSGGLNVFSKTAGKCIGMDCVCYVRKEIKSQNRLEETCTQYNRSIATKLEEVKTDVQV